MQGIIYLVTNKKNGMCYVGMTGGTLKSRKESHEKQAGEGLKTPLHKALREFGKESFEWKELETCPDLSLLADLEAKWIAELDTLVPNGYNASPGSGRAKPPTGRTTKLVRLDDEVLETLRKMTKGFGSPNKILRAFFGLDKDRDIKRPRIHRRGRE